MMWVGHGWWMTVVSVFFLILVFGMLWVVVRPAGFGSLGDSPETILKKRYASGEIGEEEYERKLKELRK